MCGVGRGGAQGRAGDDALAALAAAISVCTSTACGAVRGASACLCKAAHPPPIHPPAPCLSVPPQSHSPTPSRHPLAAGEKGVDKADMQKLRESGVFGPMSFWVTEMRNLQDPSDARSGGAQVGAPGVWGRGGEQQQAPAAARPACSQAVKRGASARPRRWARAACRRHAVDPAAAAAAAQAVGYLIRGNLRKPRLEVYDALCAKVAELFGAPPRRAGTRWQDPMAPRPPMRRPRRRRRPPATA